MDSVTGVNPMKEVGTAMGVPGTNMTDVGGLDDVSCLNPVLWSAISTDSLLLSRNCLLSVPREQTLFTERAVL